ncbi:MAG TPA: peptidylprolyl isomerase [Caulobacteraceae bacterium]|nr:peptidylprolyl isomerase [Caulobacteraceae bacterium]
MRWMYYAASAALAAALAIPAAAQPAAGALPPALAAQAQAPAAAPATRPLQEGVVATVNDELISTYDLRQQMLLLIATSGIKVNSDNLPQIQQEALRSLVDEHLQLQEIKKLPKLKISDDEIDDEIGHMAQENRMTKDQLLGVLKEAGVEADTLRQQEKAQIGFETIVGGRFGDKARVSASEVQQTLARISASAAKPQYLVGEIYLDATTNGGQDEAMNGANQLEEQILKGAPFQGVARQFSNAATAAAGGDAGWLISGEMQPEIEAALQHMQAGQMSKPIPTKDGVWIVYLREVKAGGGVTMVSLKQAAIRLPKDAPADQVSAATAKLAALKTSLTCQNVEKDAAKTDGVVASDLGESKVSDLAPEFQTVAGGLEKGQVSDPIRTDVGVHLIFMCDKRTEGTAVPTAEQVEQRLRNQQLSMLARRYMRELRATATIEMR